MSESERATPRLADEAAVIVIAGSDTTASTLASICYRLLSDKTLLARLKRELEEHMPSAQESPRSNDMDKLPLLNAIIQETIRLHPGGTHRQDRVAPDQDLVYRSADGKYNYVLPAGSIIGMSAPLVNRSPLLYDKPDEFRPERYLEDPGLKKYQFAFSKGTRQCIGINLAYQELQNFTAGIFRRYDVYDESKGERQGGPTMELYETTLEDVSMHADYVTPGQVPGSKGLRVRIRP
jgi:cytochrome P450